ncbi:ankyrin repeat domain-containing protein [Candidatus Mesenet endosymbiont of Phosphuga atrata]|uniref:ankyrin repeat domain-containing protein n=1 Tax=Candidatus Mesenet endosymbiont of Phosphuga atrata TaxID=3066221 RepID=UPI0030CCF93F
MLRSGWQLNDDSIIQNLENLEAILDENDITIPDFEDLKAILSEDSFINQDLEVKSNEVDNQSSTSFVNDQTTQPQDKESQNSIIDKAEPGSSDILQQALAVVFDSDTDNLQEGSATQASSNLATVLEEKDITSLDPEAILDENDITIPDFQDLEAILGENDIVQAPNDFSAMPNDGNAISLITEALDNAKGINEIANQSSIPSTCNKSIQTQNEESQDSIAKFDLKKRLEEVSLFTCRRCSAKIKTILGYDTVNLLSAIEDENFKVTQKPPNASIESKNLKKTKGSIYSAIENGDIKAVVELLHCGVDIDEKDSNGLIPLYIAVKYSGIDIVNALLKFNPDIELRNHYGSTPLHGAIRYSNSDIVDALLKFNPNVESRDNYGNTPLHIAVSRMHIKAVKLLLAHGANSNAQDSSGNTVLHKIINSKNGKAIFCLKQFLANKNTNLNIKNNRGESFINAVLNRFKILNQIGKEKFSQCLRLVAEHYYRLNDESKLIIRSDSEFNTIIERYRDEAQQAYNSVFNSLKSCNDRAGMVQVLQSHKFKINNKNADGYTLLHIAVSESLSLARIKMLLDINIDVDLQNNRGNTALHIAANSDKKLAITKVLLSYGANANLQNVSGQTPLHIAAARSSLSTLGVLLNFSDIDPNKQDMLGNTALHNALRSKISFRTVELLLKNDKVSLNIKNKEGQCFTSIILDKFKEQNKEQKDLVKLLAKCYDRLSDESKLIIKSDRKFYAVVEEHRKKFILYNILSQPSSSSFANEFLNIA